MGLRWVKSHGKIAPQRDRALFLIAQALILTDEPIRAYYYLDELMDEYPSSTLFPAALRTQYNIADGYLNGHKDRLLGLAVIDRSDEAVEMLFRIEQRSPGSPVAERALLRTADFYYANGDYDLAHDAYEFYAKQYPRGDQVAGGAAAGGVRVAGAVPGAAVRRHADAGGADAADRLPVGLPGHGGRGERGRHPGQDRRRAGRQAVPPGRLLPPDRRDRRGRLHVPVRRADLPRLAVGRPGPKKPWRRCRPRPWPPPAPRAGRPYAPPVVPVTPVPIP